MDQKQLFQLCVKRFGIDYEINHTIEECAELIAALNQYRRGRIAKAKVIKEMADVRFMLGVLGEGLASSEKIEAMFVRCVERAKQRLEGPCSDMINIFKGDEK